MYLKIVQHLVLLTLWVCLLNHSSGFPLFASASHTQISTSERPDAAAEKQRTSAAGQTWHTNPYVTSHASTTIEPGKSHNIVHTAPNNDKIEQNTRRTNNDLVYMTNKDKFNEPHEESSNTDQLENVDTQDQLPKLDTHSDTKEHVDYKLVDTGNVPLIQTTENRSNIYVLAHVLDMDKGIYFLPTNHSSNSSPGWVFWRIPHLYNLSNPPHEEILRHPTTPESSSGDNHSFYVLMLGLGSFVCGLMIMLILTLVILTRRFSAKTRIPQRPAMYEEISRGHYYNPRYHQQPHVPMCDDDDYYDVAPRRLFRRYSSDDVLHLLRNSELFEAHQPNTCACEQCCNECTDIGHDLHTHNIKYSEHCSQDPVKYRDDDVPLIDLHMREMNILHLNSYETPSISSSENYSSRSLSDNDVKCILLQSAGTEDSLHTNPRTDFEIDNPRNELKTRKCTVPRPPCEPPYVAGDIYDRSHDVQMTLETNWIELTDAQEHQLAKQLNSHMHETQRDDLKLDSIDSIDAYVSPSRCLSASNTPHPPNKNCSSDVSHNDISYQDRLNNLSLNTPKKSTAEKNKLDSFEKSFTSLGSTLEDNINEFDL